MLTRRRQRDGRSPIRITAFWLALLSSLAACNGKGRADEHAASHPPKAPPRHTQDAPPLTGASAWLGTEAVVDLKQLKGHIVLLDFWTYACINCMHMLPVLDRVEQYYRGKPVVVLGIHSSKFDAERVAARVKLAMLRHHVRHPVALDADMSIWKRYDIHAWPTLVFIDADGKIAKRLSGELGFAEIQQHVDRLLSQAKRAGRLAKTPARLSRPLAKPTGRLTFPGKAIAVGKDILVSDSGNHRLLLFARDGSIRWQAGTGKPGHKDGAFKAARFNYPQGLAVTKDGKTIFVADQASHSIRRIQLPERQIETIAGTGQLGYQRLTEKPQPARSLSLRSPWDIALSGDEKTLYIALAGSHQLAQMNLATNTIQRLAGSGREALIDGAASEAAFAQPSALARSGNWLYVADSEASAIRKVDLRTGRTTTIIGQGLFDFGDKTGELSKALLQHPLGVAARGGNVFVADTFNNDIKRIARGRIADWYPRRPSQSLLEPGGVSLTSKGDLIVSDSGNHRILIFPGGQAKAPKVLK